MTSQVSLWWVRRDLRLSDNPALAAAAASGAVIPVFILDPLTEAWGAAPRWRLGEGLAEFARALEAEGSRLVLRRGSALATLRALVAETGAQAVHWGRSYDAPSRTRDSEVKAALQADGIAARSHFGSRLAEPWQLSTSDGGFFKVYSPYWRAFMRRADPVPAPVQRPRRLAAPDRWPASDSLDDWRLGADMHRGGDVVRNHAAVGEAAAQDRLAAFLAGPISSYKTQRDYPAQPATSRLSENLAWGEIGPRLVWQAAAAALEAGHGCEHFLKELVWREFGWHLAYHSPALLTSNWRVEWDSFEWRGENPDAARWRRAATGIDIVDAGMRELYATGTMHNRLRMITASYLTKHLLTDWRIGLRWFEDCLIDWDPASNALGWQWVAGSGPDAAPYFRIFNPDIQANRFDPEGRYRHHWLAARASGARDFCEAVPKSWHLRPDMHRPAPALSLAEGRERALRAYSAVRSSPSDLSTTVNSEKVMKTMGNEWKF